MVLGKYISERTYLVQYYGSVPADSNMIHLLEAKGHVYIILDRKTIKYHQSWAPRVYRKFSRMFFWVLYTLALSFIPL